jgi:hypothetical protein
MKLASAPSARTFVLETDNAGMLMRSLGVLSNLRNGQLTVTMVESNPDSPFEGKIHMDSFTVVKTSFLTQLFMTVTSPTNFLDLFSGGKVSFATFDGKISFKGDVVRLRNCRMQNMSSGITFGGWVNRRKGTLAFSGNLIPLYWLNKPLSMIPLIGDLLTGGKDDGFGASSFSIKGLVDAPVLSMNPFQMLTPGPFKKMFRAGDTEEGESKN